MSHVIREHVPGCWDGRSSCTDNGGEADPGKVTFSVDILYIGKHLRLVATDDGGNVEAKNSAGQWIVQSKITEL